jgi:hypothetical protein
VIRSLSHEHDLRAPEKVLSRSYDSGGIVKLIDAFLDCSKPKIVLARDIPQIPMYAVIHRENLAIELIM